MLLTLGREHSRNALLCPIAFTYLEQQRVGLASWIGCVMLTHPIINERGGEYYRFAERSLEVVGPRNLKYSAARPEPVFGITGRIRTRAI